MILLCADTHEWADVVHNVALYAGTVVCAMCAGQLRYMPGCSEHCCHLAYCHGPVYLRMPG